MEKSESGSNTSTKQPEAAEAIRPTLGREETSFNHEPKVTPSDDVPALRYPRGDEEEKAPVIRRRVILFHLLAVGILLIWPWIFFGVVKAKGGIEASPTLARQTQNHAQDVNYFTTVVTGIFAWLVGYFFSKGVSFFTQTRISHSHLKIRRIQFLSVLKDHGPLWQRSRYGLFALFFLAVFLLVNPGLNALLIPTPILRQAPLFGTELDFASTDPTCVSWFNNNLIPRTCDWQTYNNFSFTACLAENQIADVLDSGRSNMLSTLSDNTEIFTYSQLGGLHFSGPLQGVLPVGPDGLSAFDNIVISPQLEERLGLSTTYNYTLSLQGLVSDISCAYADSSPITYIPSATAWPTWNGSCPSSQTNTSVPYSVPMSPNAIGFWACDADAAGDSYLLYFRGVYQYAGPFGNITCTASPLQLASLPVTYNSTTNNFQTETPSPGRFNTSTELISRATFALQDIMAEAQGNKSNLVAEALISYGINYFGISADDDQEYNKTDTYLRLLESMIQGMFEYEATFIRMIYSSYNSPPTPAPTTCIRAITGTVNYMIIGWEAGSKTAAYLIPMTVINLTSFALLVFVALHRNFPNFDPTDVISVIGAMGGGHVTFPAREVHGDPTDPEVLSTRVRYGPVPGAARRSSALYIHKAKPVTP